ncbi:MAG: hypothetical protein KY450_03575 [Actinobacteria bacterium]|nr:hypothetical protein [Actinomycetota bacterium]
MSDPRMEDHLVGVELQLNDLVERRERARVQGRMERVEELTREIEALQDDLAVTAERIADEQFDTPVISEDTGS